MNDHTPAIEIRNLVRRFGRAEAVNGLNLRVPTGSCYGLFGRNGAGKTTTIKCALNLLRPTAGSVRVFGLDPVRDEVAVKSRIAYVADQIAFYPWMTVDETLAYFASFRRDWNRALESELVDRFRLDRRQKANHLSKGQRTQLALVAALAAEPDLLVLDEPTSGLDPIIRREVIETVIGAFQESDPGRRTVLVSTHLISEFEGLIDRFTIVDEGRDLLTMESDAAREKFQKIRLRFPLDAAAIDLANLHVIRRHDRDVEILVNGDADAVLRRLQPRQAEVVAIDSLTLEELFVATLQRQEAHA